MSYVLSSMLCAINLSSLLYCWFSFKDGSITGSGTSLSLLYFSSHDTQNAGWYPSGIPSSVYTLCLTQDILNGLALCSSNFPQSIFVVSSKTSSPIWKSRYCCPYFGYIYPMIILFCIFSILICTANRFSFSLLSVFSK